MHYPPGGTTAGHGRGAFGGATVLWVALCAIAVAAAVAPTPAAANGPLAAPSFRPSSATSVESTGTTSTPDATPTLEVTSTPGATSTPAATPTVVFAARSAWHIRLNFPASVTNMIAVGFHQAGGPNSKLGVMKPAVTCLRIYKPATTKALLKKRIGLKLFQQALRGRGTSNLSAADCAMKPKSVVLAPVTGTVTLVKKYKLYGRYADVQLEIRADGAPSKVRVVVLHIRDPKVKVGSRVVGGVTPIATVRHFSFVSAINRYLPVKYADHVHIQLNRLK